MGDTFIRRGSAMVLPGPPSEWILIERYVARYPSDWRLVFRRGDKVIEVPVPEDVWRAFGD